MENASLIVMHYFKVSLLFLANPNDSPSFNLLRVVNVPKPCVARNLADVPIADALAGLQINKAKPALLVFCHKVNRASITQLVMDKLSLGSNYLKTLGLPPVHKLIVADKSAINVSLVIV